MAADVLSGNHAMLGIFHRTAGTLESTLEGGVYHLRFPLSDELVRTAEDVGAASLR